MQKMAWKFDELEKSRDGRGLYLVCGAKKRKL